MSSIEIRRVLPSEVKELQAIARQTFSEAFSSTNDADNMEKYLREGFSSEKLSAELNNQDSEFYFATFGNTIIGYLKLNFGKSQTDLKDMNAMEIERIYVLKEFYGKNVGQWFYQKAVVAAKQAGVNCIWLGVWEKNPRAIKFYKKNGFVEFDKHIFKLGNEEQTDIMMKLPVIPS